MRQEQTRRPARTTGRRSRHTQAPRAARPLRAWLRRPTWSRVLSFNLQPSTLNAPRSGGAVIIVVLALLTTLMVIGLFHFRWVSQELINARNHIESDATEIDPDAIFSVALRQAIVSVPDEYSLSALNASVGANNVSFWSLLAHQLGAINANGSPTDLQPHNGRGIRVDATNSTTFAVDNNHDGVPNTLLLNFSPLANAPTAGTPRDLTAPANQQYIFEPDAGYTYPDLNSLFLAYDERDPVTGVRVIKPSFAAPGYLSAQRLAGSFADQYTGTGTISRVLRPHRDHAYGTVAPFNVANTAAVNNANRRYLATVTSAASGDRQRVLQPFDFPDDDDQMGVWEGVPDYGNLDKDVDQDGAKDSIDVDLGHGIIELPGGRQVVPIFQFKITDLDALLNLNAIGNQALVTLLSNSGGASAQSIYGSTSWTHQSNKGLSRSEINPLFALRADPADPNFVDTADVAWATAPIMAWVADRTTATPNTTALIGLYGPLNRLKAANIELSRMLYGSPEFFAGDLNYAGTSQLVGRYGVDAPFTVRNFLGDGATLPIVTPSGSVPSPGAAAADDDGNDITSGSTAGAYYARMNGHGGYSYVDTNPASLNSKLTNVYIPPFVHPLDYAGTGDLNGSAGATYRRDPALVGGSLGANDEIGELISGAINANSPVRWPQYPVAAGIDLYQNQGSAAATVLNDSAAYSTQGFQTMRDATGLQAGTASDLLWNNPNEMNQFISLGAGADAPFSIAEIAALQLSDSDWNRLGAASQLRKLLPFNFENNKQAASIRRKFTTASWDRLEFSFSPYNHPTNRQWEFNNPLDLTALGLGTSNAFPPQFGTVLASRHDRLIDTPGAYVDIVASPLTGTISANDPLRPELRRLLTTLTPSSLLAVSLRDRFPRHKLNLNRILSDDALSGGAGSFDEYGNPRYRELVPHVTAGATLNAALDALVHENLTTTLVSGLGTTHPLNRFDDLLAGTATPAVQEWWARYDRQRLARDIYVLLYTLGGGDDAFDPTAGGYPGTPDNDANGVNDLVQQMAQFAVNYVDALDRDNCITKFVYDPNLSDGWSTGGLQSVYGVEGQQLTFSEGLLVKVPKQTTDFSTTLFDESVDDHRWLYLELRNVSPFPVKLTEGFRIMRLDTSSGPEIPQIAAEFQPVGSAHKQIAAGENATLACHDGFVVNGGGAPIGSEFVADYVNGTELEYVIPRGVTLTETNNSAQPVNRFDFDLTAWDDGTTTDDEFVTWYTPPGSPWTGVRLVERTAGGGSGVDQKATFALQRRLNPYLTWTPATLDDAEWVEVDRISLTQVQQFDSAAMEGMKFEPSADSQPAVAAALATVKSRERMHHFTYSIHKHPGAGQQNHSLFARTAAAGVKHDANDYTVANLPASMPDATDIRIWQPHFDRDFSSAMELLSVPLYGLRGADDASADPVAATPNIGPVFPIDAWAPLGGVTYNLVDNSSLAQIGRLAGFNTAQLRFLFPGGTPGAGHPFATKPQATYVANRWYRLFDFLDIPDSADDVVETALQYQKRTPGKLNRNLIRHESVLAGLVDDDVHHNGIANADRPTADIREASLAARNWMTELQQARDVFNISGVYIPGDPTAKPFRPAGWIDPVDGDLSLESSLLRFSQNAAGTTNLNHLGLFEARPTADVGTEAIDYHTRQRLLAKVANNSTERSHLFAMWVGFDLHEAHVNATGQVQIGGKATDLPSYRMFCVVDMSRLEEAYDPVSGTFDFRKFIIHQQLLP